eukprot:gene23674-29917_t
MGLPYFKLTILEVPLDFKNRTILLPKESLLNVIGHLKADEPLYHKFRYVYYSEGDQILHLRDPEVIFDAIDSSNGTFVAIPHRMQTLTLKQDFPSSLHSLWGAAHAQDVPHAQVVVEDVHATRGSCCSNGDVEVARCYGWWYQCVDYGLKNFTTWMKFGENGFTMPLVTEHKATCEYHAERHLCEVPSDCVNRIPSVPSGVDRPLRGADVCKEIVRSVHLGPSDEVAEALEVARNTARKQREKDKADRDAVAKLKAEGKALAFVAGEFASLSASLEQQQQSGEVYVQGEKRSRSKKRMRQGKRKRKKAEDVEVE